MPLSIIHHLVHRHLLPCKSHANSCRLQTILDTNELGDSYTFFFLSFPIAVVAVVAVVVVVVVVVAAAAAAAADAAAGWSGCGANGATSRAPDSAAGGAGVGGCSARGPDWSRAAKRGPDSDLY